jgi:hypothetical protein
LKKADSEDGLSTGLSLLYVWKAEPITGLTRLLTLALRLLTLVEMPGRRGLEQTTALAHNASESIQIHAKPQLLFGRWQIAIPHIAVQPPLPLLAFPDHDVFPLIKHLVAFPSEFVLPH